MKLDSRLARIVWCTSFLLVVSLTSASGGHEPAPSVIAPSVEFEGVLRSAIGVTRQGMRIDVFLQPDDINLQSGKTRLLLIGGIDGDRHSVDAVIGMLRWFYQDPSARPLHRHFTLSGIPAANPAALPAVDAEVKPDLTLGYPPSGRAYHDDQQTDETAYLWRWLGMHAPDLVIDVRVAETQRWLVPSTFPATFSQLLPETGSITTAGDLIVELGRNAVCQVGQIPAIRLQTPPADAIQHVDGMLSKLQQQTARIRSPARRALQRRLERTPLAVSRQLATHYGHELKQVVYIPTIALMGRARLGELTHDPAHLTDVRRIVKPYFDGDVPTRPTSGSGLSGHLIFAELASMSEGAERARYIELARNAADLAFDTSNEIKPIMPFHHEMSDAVFMGGPILAAVGNLTHDERYYEACLSHLRAMRALVLRDDGLYRHSPLDEAAWGRGNGFPALGLAMCLTEFPADHPARPALLEHFQKHCRALARHQDPTGCWHQVIDRPESYRELSSTCMITYALARGIRSGWLEAEEFQTVVERAWYAIRTRVAEDGRLVDVCTGTGKQPSLRAYYDRTAILGRDPRGGAMALLVATELAHNRTIAARP